MCNEIVILIFFFYFTDSAKLHRTILQLYYLSLLYAVINLLLLLSVPGFTSVIEKCFIFPFFITD